MFDLRCLFRSRQNHILEQNLKFCPGEIHSYFLFLKFFIPPFVYELEISIANFKVKKNQLTRIFILNLDIYLCRRTSKNRAALLCNVIQHHVFLGKNDWALIKCEIRGTNDPKNLSRIIMSHMYTFISICKSSRKNAWQHRRHIAFHGSP